MFRTTPRRLVVFALAGALLTSGCGGKCSQGKRLHVWTVGSATHTMCVSR